MAMPGLQIRTGSTPQYYWVRAGCILLVRRGVPARLDERRDGHDAFLPGPSAEFAALGLARDEGLGFRVVGWPMGGQGLVCQELTHPLLAPSP